jgi:hypothetical protein
MAQEIIDLLTQIRDLQQQQPKIIIKQSSRSEKQFDCKNER